MAMNTQKLNIKTSELYYTFNVNKIKRASYKTTLSLNNVFDYFSQRPLLQMNEIMEIPNIISAFKKENFFLKTFTLHFEQYGINLIESLSIKTYRFTPTQPKKLTPANNFL